VEVPGRSLHGDRGRRVHPGDGHQASHDRVVQRLGGQPPFHFGEFGTVDVELAQQGAHGLPLVGRRSLMLQPGPAAGAEESQSLAEPDASNGSGADSSGRCNRLSAATVLVAAMISVASRFRRLGQPGQDRFLSR